MRFFAILLFDRATHGEAPNDILIRGFEKNGVSVSELKIALLLIVIENRYRFLPSITTISGNHGENVTHVLLSIGHGSKGDYKMPILPLGYEGLPDSPRIRMLIHMSQFANVRNIAFIITEVSLFAGKRWQGRERNQGQK